MTKLVLNALFAAILVLLPMPTVTANPQSESFSLDGSSWNALSSVNRIYWIVGYDHGFTNALRLAEKLRSLGDRHIAPYTTTEKLQLRNVQRYTSQARILSNQKIVDQMTLLYKDFRNTPICWANAEPIAELSLTVGAPSEAELDAVRREDAKAGCTIPSP